jgi:hypothetical protein
MIDSPYTKEEDQLSLDVIQEIFGSSPLDGLCVNGKVSLDRLTETLYESSGGFSTKEFQKIFNNKK